jgi:hypothetical protein
MAASLRPPQSIDDLFVRVLFLLISSRNDPFRVERKLAVQQPRSERLELLVVGAERRVADADVNNLKQKIKNV